MRISELLNESEMLDEISRPPLVDARRILKNAGYEHLGSGTLALIFAKPNSSTCLKLFLTSDQAYIEFINMVMRIPNPHFPKFKGKLIKVTNDYYAIQMERLTPITSEMRYMTDTIDNYTTDIHYNGVAGHITLENMKNIEKKQPGITEACDIIANNISKRRMIDMHSANFMMRGNVLVIIDPVAY